MTIHGSKMAEVRAGMNEFDSLTDEIVELRAKGFTWSQVEVKTGIPAAQCAIRARDYLTNSYSTESVQESRQIQIRRLELLMGYLWEQVEAGDFLTQGKNTANLINVIQQVTELLDLRKDRLRDEQIRLTQEQSGLIITIVDAVRTAVLDQVMNLLMGLSEYDKNSGSRSIPSLATVRAALERDWGGWFATAAEEALEANDAGTKSDKPSSAYQQANPENPYSIKNTDTTGSGNYIRGEITR